MGATDRMIDGRLRWLEREVRVRLHEKREAGHTVELDKFVDEVIASWEPPGGADASMWLGSARAALRDIAQRLMEES